MAKSKLTPENYQNLKNFMALYAKRFFYDKGVPTNGDFVLTLEDIEKTKPARAEDCLIAVITDFVEMASDFPFDEVAAFDGELKCKGIITLTELRRRYSKQYARVVKRGHIKSEEEYYLLKGVVDGGSLDMTPTELQTLSDMLFEYEEKNNEESKVNTRRV